MSDLGFFEDNDGYGPSTTEELARRCAEKRKEYLMIQISNPRCE